MKFYALLVCLAVMAGCQTASTESSETSSKSSNGHPPLHLVLGLDGVGYETMKKLYDGGYFRQFYQPAPMVSSFPSISDPVWARLMRAPMNPSYQKSYFDTNIKTETGAGQAVGSLLNHLTQPPQYEHGFDFKAEGMLEHFALMTWTETSALYWLDALEKKFFETNDKDIFFAFIMNTDIIAHTMGEKKLFEYLVILDKRLKRLREKVKSEYGYDLTITMVSDHGNYFVKPQSITYEEALTKLGWHFADTLTNKNDVGFVIPEIVSFGALYTLKGSEAKLAKDLSSLEGVFCTAYVKEPNAVRVIAQNGSFEAEIQVDPAKKTVLYKVIKGRDLLEQTRFFHEPTMTWKNYFIKSYDSNLPYAAVRLWEGFYSNSLQPASVLVVPAKGRVFANSTLKMITAVKGLASTHGSLFKTETQGILISTKEPMPPIRPDDFGDIIPLDGYSRNFENMKTIVNH